MLVIRLARTRRLQHWMHKRVCRPLVVVTGRTRSTRRLQHWMHRRVCRPLDVVTGRTQSTRTRGRNTIEPDTRHWLCSKVSPLQRLNVPSRASRVLHLLPDLGLTVSAHHKYLHLLPDLGLTVSAHHECVTERHNTCTSFQTWVWRSLPAVAGPAWRLPCPPPPRLTAESAPPPSSRSPSRACRLVVSAATPPSVPTALERCRRRPNHSPFRCRDRIFLTQSAISSSGVVCIRPFYSVRRPPWTGYHDCGCWNRATWWSVETEEHGGQ